MRTIGALFALSAIAVAAHGQEYAPQEIMRECAFLKDVDAKIVCWKKHVDANPQFTAGFMFLGRSYREKRDYAKSIDSYTRGLAITPRHAVGLNSRGETYVEWGKLDQAKADFRAALAINPNFEAAKTNLAKIVASQTQVVVTANPVAKKLGERPPADPDNAQPASNQPAENSPGTRNPILDCSKPGTLAGRLICNDADLTRSYLELGLAYKKLYDAATEDERKKIQDEQVRWVRNRNKECGVEGNADASPQDLDSARECLMRRIDQQLTGYQDQGRRPDLAANTPTTRGITVPGEEKSGVVASQKRKKTVDPQAWVEAQKSQIDEGRGFDIRGVKLGMRAGRLPVEYNSLPITPSPSMAAAYQANTCSRVEDYRSADVKSCLIIFFDGTTAERTVYAVYLSNLKLAPFDPNVVNLGERILQRKYGQQTFYSAGGTRNLQWWGSADITRAGFTDVANLLILNPERLQAGFFGLSGDILWAEISRPVVEGVYIEFANLALVDVIVSVKNYQASVKKVQAQKDDLARKALENTPRPRF